MRSLDWPRACEDARGVRPIGKSVLRELGVSAARWKRPLPRRHKFKSISISLHMSCLTYDTERSNKPPVGRGRRGFGDSVYASGVTAPHLCITGCPHNRILYMECCASASVLSVSKAHIISAVSVFLRQSIVLLTSSRIMTKALHPPLPGNGMNFVPTDNSSLDRSFISANVDCLLARMTVQEKISLLAGKDRWS